jgi:SAM-dependent methyltransferase
MSEFDRIRKLMESVPPPELAPRPYPEEREFSRVLDLELGFDITSCEARILREFPATPWAGLDPETLQTPYAELRRMLRFVEPSPGARIADIGAGYGRMGLLIGALYPELSFIGVEVSPVRAREGARMLASFPNVEWVCGDVTSSGGEFPDADHYFMYDFSDLESLFRVIDCLKPIARKRKISVIGRGRRTRDHIERMEPWLTGIVPPGHFGNFSIYRSGI